MALTLTLKGRFSILRLSKTESTLFVTSAAPRLVKGCGKPYYALIVT